MRGGAHANKEDARTAAREMGEEGPSAIVARPAIGDGWSVKVEGDPDAVLALHQRMSGNTGVDGSRERCM
jgi:hypothetical protein